jgi:hypothetical protein
MESTNQFCRSQYGFLQGLSTEMATMELVDRIIKDMDEGKTPINIYIDLSKAFDTLNHTILITKLRFYGVAENTIKLFESYLQNRKQYVEWDNTKSECEYLTTGVPQGSILGPLLFIIYVNDIINASKLYHLIMYADDTTMYTAINTKHQTEKHINDTLNKELNKITEWFKVNKLALNNKKTKYMMFTVHRRPKPEIILQIENKNLDMVEQFNFLGIELDDKITWSSHINKISLKITRALGIINKLKLILPQRIMMILYNTLIVPHLNYGLLVWGTQTSRILVLQKKAVRMLSLSKYNSHTSPIFKMLEILQIKELYKLRMLKFYYNLQKFKTPIYFSNCLNSNNIVVTYNTRFQQNQLLPHVHIKYEFAKKGIHYKLVQLVNDTPKAVMSKVSTHSLNGFAQYFKQHILNEYSITCNITNCYICNR